MIKYFKTKKGIVAADVTEAKNRSGKTIYRPVNIFCTDAPYQSHQLITDPTPEERAEGDRRAANAHGAKVDRLWELLDLDRVAKELNRAAK